MNLNPCLRKSFAKANELEASFKFKKVEFHCGELIC